MSRGCWRGGSFSGGAWQLGVALDWAAARVARLWTLAADTMRWEAPAPRGDAGDRASVARPQPGALPAVADREVRVFAAPIGHSPTWLER